jgi:hypothetical protein
MIVGFKKEISACSANVEIFFYKFGIQIYSMNENRVNIKYKMASSCHLDKKKCSIHKEHNYAVISRLNNQLWMIKELLGPTFVYFFLLVEEYMYVA